MGCSNCNSIPLQKPFINNPEFTKISEIETELYKSLKVLILNIKMKMPMILKELN